MSVNVIKENIFSFIKIYDKIIISKYLHVIYKIK